MLKNFDRIFSLYDRDCQTKDRYYTSERAIHGLLGIGVLSTICFVFHFFLFCVKSKSVHGPHIECSVRSPSADPEGGTGGPDPPGKSQVIWVSIGNK